MGGAIRGRGQNFLQAPPQAGGVGRANPGPPAIPGTRSMRPTRSQHKRGVFRGKGGGTVPTPEVVGGPGLARVAAGGAGARERV